jgi:hypothetical protein
VVAKKRLPKSGRLPLLGAFAASAGPNRRVLAKIDLILDPQNLLSFGKPFGLTQVNSAYFAYFANILGDSAILLEVFLRPALYNLAPGPFGP